jgi:hypothetical protein
MSDDGVCWHLRPDLIELLVDAIPLLTRSKESCLNVFRSAGVPGSAMSDLAAKVAKDRDSIGKHEITRTLLTRMNQRGDVPDAIRQRRELVRRVVEWEDFSTCYSDNVLKAQGAIAAIRKAVNRYDSFTEMKNAKEEEQRKRRAEQDAKGRAAEHRAEEHEAIKKDFYALFGFQDSQRRGKALESVLNRLFKHADILIREAFTIRCDESGKPLEQIDGVIEIDHIPYLVEMKWWDEPIGVPEITQHIGRILMRMRDGTIRGMYISYKGYTETAVTTAKEGRAAGAAMFLVTLADFVRLLEEKTDIGEFCRSRARAALVDKQPFVRP